MIINMTKTSLKHERLCILPFSFYRILQLCLLSISFVSAVVIKPSGKFIDLTYALNNETMAWPGRNTTFYTEVEGITPKGFWNAARGFCTSEHSSTHIDAPYHFNQFGRRLHEIPFDDLIDVPGVVIDIFDKVHRFEKGKLVVIKNYALTREDVIEWEAKHGKVPQGAVVLLRTGWEARWGNEEEYLGIRGNLTDEAWPTNLNFPGFDVSSAKFLAVERQVRGVGIDTVAIDPGNTRHFLAHRLFASRNIYMLEMVANLHLLPPRDFKLLLLPFKIDFATGAPCRVVARFDFPIKDSNENSIEDDSYTKEL